MTSDNGVVTAQPTVTTLSVNVKVVKIGVKQCTLAVFRQLVDKPFDPLFGQVTGTIWGWVNYCPPGDVCGSYDRPFQWSTHRHFVWSDGERLYRSIAWTGSFTPMTVEERDAKVTCLRSDYLAAEEPFRDRVAWAKEQLTLNPQRTDGRWLIQEHERRRADHEAAVANVMSQYRSGQERLDVAGQHWALWRQVDATEQLFVAV